jgi:hypothetical protein
MQVLNIHERELHTSPERVGALIDALSSAEDEVWPKHLWSPMIFDRPLSVGATGGHGPVRYFVETYTPGRMIKFRFTGPKGFNGYHLLNIANINTQSCTLRHTLEMTTHGKSIISWPLMFRPMHDALIEDAFNLAEVAIGQRPPIRQWSLWVRILRWLLSKKQAQTRSTNSN